MINSNAYVVDLPPDFGINCIFNVEDLISYRDTFDISSDPFMNEPTHDFSSESPYYLQFLQNYLMQFYIG